MKKTKFTQAQMASILACSQASVSQWQQGHSPSGKNIYKIKEILQYLKILTRQAANKQSKCEGIRKSYGLTGANVAFFLGVSAPTIYRWEKGELPKGKKLAQINDAVKVIKSIIPKHHGTTKVA